MNMVIVGVYYVKFVGVIIYIISILNFEEVSCSLMPFFYATAIDT